MGIENDRNGRRAKTRLGGSQTVDSCLVRYRVVFVGALTDEVRGDLSSAGMILASHEEYSSVFPTGALPEPDHHAVWVDAPTAIEAVGLVRGVVDQRGAYTVFDDAELV